MIKVLIRRTIAESKSKELNLLFVKLRSLAMQQEGYIGGETLKRLDAPGEYLVISRWRSIEDWTRWLVSKERADIQGAIDALTDSETRFEVYGH
ncbi:MAG: antibiotic biosynthesis monooxygenase [Desulfobacteraceae bacterium]|nr:antibiotic biosynthesis monooxygenase [Desulfobacteraceae bacterium]